MISCVLISLLFQNYQNIIVPYIKLYVFPCIYGLHHCMTRMLSGAGQSKKIKMKGKWLL